MSKYCKDLNPVRSGKRRTICEDIIDTGFDAISFDGNLEFTRRKFLKIAVLLDVPKPVHQKKGLITGGFQIPNKFCRRFAGLTLTLSKSSVYRSCR